MKDKILAIHPVSGIITFEDLIKDLEIMLNDNLFLEDIVYGLLKEETNMSEEDISSLFNYSISNRLKWIIFVLKDLL